MAICNIYVYYSSILVNDITFYAILPNSSVSNSKTLYLLHGAMESGETIIHNSNVMELADKYHLTIIIPTLGNCFYVNRYYRFICDELVPYTKKEFNLSNKREATFIGGYSMGGYGALYNGFKRQDLFSKVISISGALDLPFCVRFVRNCGARIPHNLDKYILSHKEQYDLSSLIKGSNQKIYLSCGKDDLLTFVNEKMEKILKEKNIPYFFKIKNGNHDWNFWKKEIENVTEWIVK